MAAKKKTSSYSSEDDTRPCKSSGSELRGVIDAVQQGLRAAAAKNPTKFSALANKVRAIMKGDATPVKYNIASPGRSQRTSPSSGGSMGTGGASSQSIRAVASGRRSTSNALSVSPLPLRTREYVICETGS